MSSRITKKNKRTNRRKTNKRTNRRKTNKRRNSRRRQRGGNFNEKQNMELKSALIEVGFTEPELTTAINKFNDISQIQGKKFDWFINFIEENYNPTYNNELSTDPKINKQNLMNWLDEHYEKQTERVGTDSEFTTTSSFEE
jgi:hypothetical protein